MRVILNYIREFFRFRFNKWQDKASPSIKEYATSLSKIGKAKIIDEIIHMAASLNKNHPVVTDDYKKELGKTPKRVLIRTACTLRVLESKVVKQKLKKLKRKKHIKAHMEKTLKIKKGQETPVLVN